MNLSKTGSMDEIFTYYNTQIEPGEYKLVKKSIGLLPSGNKLHIISHVFRSLKPGPVVLFSAGMHGDEVNGVEILRRAVKEGVFNNLLKGTVIVIPILNVFGFINYSRDVPDGKDVNRSFPGSKSGSLASRIAKEVSSNILPFIDFGVDFHTGGANRYNIPQIRYLCEDSEQTELAQAFNAPFNINSKMLSQTMRKTAYDDKKSILIFEGGEALRYDKSSIEHALRGINNLLIHKEMKAGTPNIINTVNINETSWVRASGSGLFNLYKSSGDKVEKKEIIGVINEVFGSEEKPVYSSHDGYIIGHNNAPVVTEGDALFNIGRTVGF